MSLFAATMFSFFALYAGILIGIFMERSSHKRRLHLYNDAELVAESRRKRLMHTRRA